MPENYPLRNSVVYIFHAEGTTRVKIGRSGELAKRHNAIHTASPFPVKLLRAIPTADAAQLESVLHLRYHAYRVHREWFELPPEILEALLLAPADTLEPPQCSQPTGEDLDCGVCTEIDSNMYDIWDAAPYQNDPIMTTLLGMGWLCAMRNPAFDIIARFTHQAPMTVLAHLLRLADDGMVEIHWETGLKTFIYRLFPNWRQKFDTEEGA